VSVLVVAAPRSGEEEGANQGQATGTAEAQTEPAPIADQGYRLTWSDQFNTLDNSKWEQCWYEPDPGPHNIFVSNGLLHLRMRRVDGYMKASVCSIDLINNVPHNVFRQGYLEARSRVPVGKGAWSAFWLSSEYHARNWEWPHTARPSGRDRHLRDAQQRAAHAIHDAAPQCEREVWSPRRDASGRRAGCAATPTRRLAVSDRVSRVRSEVDA
jgi:hypothetical protein